MKRTHQAKKHPQKFTRFKIAALVLSMVVACGKAQDSDEDPSAATATGSGTASTGSSP